MAGHDFTLNSAHTQPNNRLENDARFTRASQAERYIKIRNEMNRETKKRIWNETNLISMKRGGNELFRVGIAPFENGISLPIKVDKTIPIQKGQFTGSFFYRLNRSAISQGFFWKHNGPTADLYHFKVMMIKKTDDTNISCFSTEQIGIDFLYNALESACYEDFDYPLLGFDILVDEVKCKRFALSEAALFSQVTLLLNFALSRMVGEKYFDIYERKNE